MTRQSKLWQVAAAVFAVVNVGGAGYAVAVAEPMHAAVHVVLIVAGYVAWQLTAPARQKDQAPAQLGNERLEYLQQSVDAIALEVERIGEAQRFNEKLRAERTETSPPQTNQ